MILVLVHLTSKSFFRHHLDVVSVFFTLALIIVIGEKVDAYYVFDFKLDNWTLTRSILAENSPDYLSGARLGYKPNQKTEWVAVP
jgi:hypothetical protein